MKDGMCPCARIQSATTTTTTTIRADLREKL